jgi:mannose-6-phosphate isomerase-like protein (cupin superfamily)
MIFVLEGRVTIDIDGHRIDAEESTTLTIPVGRAADLEFTRDSRLLVVDVVTN